MSKNSSVYELRLLNRLKNGDPAAFTALFNSYYKDLVRFAFGLLRDPDAAEEVVQDLFVWIWENREHFSVHTSFRSLLLKSVQNRCLDRIRFREIRERYAGKKSDSVILCNDTENYVLFSELETALNKAVSRIPEKLSEVLRLSRFEGLTYAEIASRLGVSVRTVETRMVKALEFLKGELHDFFTMLLLFIYFFKH